MRLRLDGVDTEQPPVKAGAIEYYRYKLHKVLKCCHISVPRLREKKMHPLLLNSSELKGMATSQTLPDEGSEALQKQCVSIILQLIFR